MGLKEALEAVHSPTEQDSDCLAALGGTHCWESSRDAGQINPSEARSFPCLGSKLDPARQEHALVRNRYRIFGFITAKARKR